MRNSRLPSGPPSFLKIAVLSFLVVLMCRVSLNFKGTPVFSCQEQGVVYVEVAGEEIESGIRQLGDGSVLRDVINLTGVEEGQLSENNELLSRLLVTGERLTFEKKGREIKLLHSGWIAASQRIALGITLHPDQMKETDWPALPGIGSVLAKRIEDDRQKNGDFGSLGALSRVKGIGKKSVERWRGFF